jgi:hypothetical protein
VDIDALFEAESIPLLRDERDEEEEENEEEERKMVPGDALLGRQVFERGYRDIDLKVNLFSISLLSGNFIDGFLFQDSRTRVYSLPRICESHTFRLDPGSCLL